jgi:hypothetical protein
MGTKAKIGVILTVEGRGLLANELRTLMRDGRYFNCVSVQQDGSFLNMKVEDPSGKLPTLAQISIPLHFVLYMVSADAASRLGFK